ncbi:MAG: hypothetical protein K0V04_10030 [Deltaproteobacteria bacterium]|nr:hypothetical protein [Deltaproteobacteria bacterium]
MPKAILVKRANPGGTSSRTYEAFLEIDVPHLLTHRGARYQLEGVGEFEVAEAHVTADGVVLYEETKDLGNPDEPRYVDWMSELNAKGWRGDLRRRRLHFRPIAVPQPPAPDASAARPQLELVDPDDEN